MPGDRRGAVGWSAAVGAEHLGAGEGEVLGPHVGGQRAAVELHGAGLAGAQRQVLLHADAERFAQRSAEPARMDGIVLVHGGGEAGNQQRATTGDVAGEVRRRGGGEQVGGGRDHHPVAGQIRARVGEVHTDAVPPQPLVVGAHPLPELQVVAGAPLQVLGPERLPVIEHGHPGAGAPTL